MNYANTKKTQLLINPVAMTNSATQTANLDTRGADFATIVLSFKAEVNTNAVGPTLSLLESDDTVVTNFATVVANRTNEDLASAKLVRYDVDTRGRKRYLRLSVTTATATNDDVTVTAMGILDRREDEANSTSDLVASGSVVVTV